MLKVTIHNNYTGKDSKSFDCQFRSWNSYQRFEDAYKHLGGMSNTFSFDVWDEGKSFGLPVITADHKGLLKVIKALYPDAQDWQDAIAKLIEFDNKNS